MSSNRETVIYSFSSYNIPKYTLMKCFQNINPKFSFDIYEFDDILEWYGEFDASVGESGTYTQCPIPTVEEAQIEYDKHKLLNTEICVECEYINKDVLKRLMDNDFSIVRKSRLIDGKQYIMYDTLPENWLSAFPESSTNVNNKINIALGALSEIKYSSIQSFDYGLGAELSSSEFVWLNKFALCGCEFFNKVMIAAKGNGVIELYNITSNESILVVDINETNDNFKILHIKKDICSSMLAGIRAKSNDGIFTIYSIKFV